MKTMMQQLRWGAAAIPAALILTACGGGGGSSSSSPTPAPPPPPPAMVSVTGVVATGNAEVGAVVTLIDKNGLTAASSPTDVHGVYTIAAGAYVFPVALTANARSGTLVSLLAPASAPANGSTATVNVTTLTTALASLLTNGNPTDTATLRGATATQVASAITVLDTALQNVLSAKGVPATLNPITDPLTANGTGADAVINAVSIVPSAGGPTLILTPTAPDQAASPGIPLVTATVTTPPAPLPTPPATTVPASATATYLDYLQKALQDCAALPLAQRAASARCGDIVDPAFKQNGYSNLATLIPDLGSDLSVGATFSLPKTLFYRVINTQNQSLVRIYYTLNDGSEANFVSVAQELAMPRMLSDGTSVTWDLIGNQSLYDATISSRVQRNVALDSAPGDINIYLSGLVITFNPDGPDPAAANVNSVKVTGPGLPASGVWLRRSVECNGGTTMHLMATPPANPPLSTAGILSTTSFFKWDWQPVTVGQTFTPGGPGIWAAAPVDMTTIPQYATYTFTLYDATGTQVGSFGRSNLAPPTAAAAGAALAWNSLDTSFIASFMTPGGSLAAAQASVTPSWSRNASAPAPQTVYLGASESTATTFLASSAIAHVAPSATSVTVSAPATAAAGIATTCNGTFSPFQVDGDSRYVQLRQRDANGLQIVDQYLANYVAPATLANALLNGAYFAAQFQFSPSGSQPNTPAVGSPLLNPVGFSDYNFAPMTFDGMGNWSLTATGNFDGVQSAPLPATGTYSVTNTGSAYAVTSASTGGTAVGTGAALADGSAGFTVDVTAGQVPQISLVAKSGTGFNNASMNGRYTVVEFYFDPTTQPNMVAQGLAMPVPRGFHDEVNVLTFDGIGTATLVSGVNNKDGAGTNNTPSSFTYSVAGDGTLTGNPAIAHWTLAAGGQLAIGDTLSGTPYQISAIVKNGSNMSNASLNGTYAIGMYTFNSLAAGGPPAPAAGLAAPAPTGFTAALGSIAFDGAGNFTVSGTANTDGNVAPIQSLTGTYSLATDGTLILSGTANQGIGSAQGTVSGDGNLLVFARTSGNPALMFGVKQ